MGKWLGVIQRDVYISPGFEKVLHSTARSVGLEYVLLELISRSILYVLPPADAVTVDGARARMSFNYVAAEREQRAAATAEISSSAAELSKLPGLVMGWCWSGGPGLGRADRPGPSIFYLMGRGPARPTKFS